MRPRPEVAFSPAVRAAVEEADASRLRRAILHSPIREPSTSQIRRAILHCAGQKRHGFVPRATMELERVLSCGRCGND